MAPCMQGTAPERAWDGRNDYYTSCALINHSLVKHEHPSSLLCFGKQAAFLF